MTVSVGVDEDGLPAFDPFEYTRAIDEALCIDVVDCQRNAVVFTVTTLEQPANPFAQLLAQSLAEDGAVTGSTLGAATETVGVEVSFFVQTTQADDFSPAASAYMPMLDVLPALLAPDAAALLGNRASLHGIRSATFAAMAGVGASMAGASDASTIVWDMWLIVAVAVSGTLFCVIWIVLMVCCGCCPSCFLCCACCPKRDKVKILTGSATWGDAWTSGSADASVLTGLGRASAFGLPSPIRSSGRMPHYSASSAMAESIQYLDPVAYPSYLVDPAIRASMQGQGIASPPQTVRKRPGPNGESYIELVDPSMMASPDHELSVLYDGDAEYFGQDFNNPVYGNAHMFHVSSSDPNVRSAPQLMTMMSPQRQTTAAFPTSMPQGSSPTGRSSYASPAVSPPRASYASPQRMVTMSLPQQPRMSYVQPAIRRSAGAGAQAVYSGARQQFSRPSAVHFNPAGPSYGPQVRMSSAAAGNNGARPPQAVRMMASPPAVRYASPPPQQQMRRQSSAVAMGPPPRQSQSISRPTTPHTAMEQGHHVPFDSSWNGTDAALMAEMQPINQWTTLRPNEGALQVLHDGDVMFGQSQNNPLYDGEAYNEDFM